MNNLILACDAGPAWRKELNKSKEFYPVISRPSVPRGPVHSVPDGGSIFIIFVLLFVVLMICGPKNKYRE